MKELERARVLLRQIRGDLSLMDQLDEVDKEIEKVIKRIRKEGKE